MKNFKFFTLAIVVLSLVMGSCKKDDDDDDKNTDSGSYYFNVTIDGEKYHLGTSMADIDDVSANIGGSLKDEATNLKVVNLNLYAENIKATGAGTYTPSTLYSVVYTDKDGTIWYYNSGSFTVSELNLNKWTVKGTFSNIVVSNGSQTKELKDGSFYLYLIHV